MTWEALLSVIYFTTFFRIPLIIAFHFHHMGAKLNQDTEIAIDVFILLEMIMRFFLAPVKNSLETPDLLNVARKYLRTMFIFDALGTLPGLFTAERITTLYWLKLFRYLRSGESVGRSRETVIRLISRFSEMPVRTIDIIFNMLTLLMQTMFFLHLSACMYLGVAFINPEKSDLDISFDAVKESDLTAYEDYLASIYFIMTTFSLVGYGEMSGTTSEEMCLLLILEFAGISVFSMLIARITRIIQSKGVIKDLVKEKEDNLDRWVLKLANAYPEEELNNEIEDVLRYYLQQEQQYALHGYLFRYNFYNLLSPQLKNELIFLLQRQQIDRFYHFFNDT